MTIEYRQATPEDAAPIYELCKQLICRYERTEDIDYPRVLKWVRKKIENAITDYTAIFADGEKAGYYHFYQNEDGEFELDDLYVFPQFQNRGIGSQVVEKCCASVSAPVMLYVFAENKGAIALYQRLGFVITETIRDTRYIMKNR